MRRNLPEFERHVFDLVVIGGGIVGAALARDAARRGLKVALVEAGDFAGGASEAMSHLVHGGLRYLATGQVGIVRESLRERRIWLDIAPHAIARQPFLLPLPAGAGRIGRMMLAAGVALFEALGGHGLATRLSPSEAVAAEPVLDGLRLAGALCYHDCRVDRPERVVLDMLADAVAHGAIVSNHAEAVALSRDGRHLALSVRDTLAGDVFRIAGLCVVNAAGAWAGQVADQLLPGQRQVRVTLSRGIHFIVEPLAATHALAFVARREHAFFIPWQGMTLVGTTDDPHAGGPDSVAAEPDDIARLRAKACAFLPAAEAAIDRRVQTFVAARALPGAASDTYGASRDMAFADHAGDGMPGFFTLTGGKWTTARAMAETGIDGIVRHLGVTTRACDTAHVPLPPFGAPDGDEAARIERAIADEMAMTGDDVARRLGRLHELRHPGLGERAAKALVRR